MMFRKRTNDVWDMLAVEVAVKLQDLLEPNEDYPPYEYYPEAKQIVSTIRKDTKITEQDIEKVIAETLSRSLEFDYNPNSFVTVAKFIFARQKYFHKYGQ